MNERRLETTPDERLDAKVGQSIRELSYRQVHEVKCHSRNGVVTLAGTLASFYFKQMAQVNAAKVPGVTRVVNEIHVSGWRQAL